MCQCALAGHGTLLLADAHMDLLDGEPSILFPMRFPTMPCVISVLEKHGGIKAPQLKIDYSIQKAGKFLF